MSQYQDGIEVPDPHPDGYKSDSPDAPRCPNCHKRGASSDWAKWGGCPFRCGYLLPAEEDIDIYKEINQ